MEVNRNYRVLIVDDNQVYREAFRHMLESLLGNRLELLLEASNGKEAVEMVSQQYFHYVFMDIAMPVMDGIEATRLIDRQVLRIIIIGLSFHNELEKVKSIIEAGAKTFINKEEMNIDKLKQVFENRTWL
jgi:CheY-like chemotaxis protein